MVLRSSAWSLPWEKVILMMLLTPFGVDLWNTLLYHLEALQLSFSPFFLCSFPTLSEGYNTAATKKTSRWSLLSLLFVSSPIRRCVDAENRGDDSPCVLLTEFLPMCSVEGFTVGTIPLDDSHFKSLCFKEFDICRRSSFMSGKCDLSCSGIPVGVFARDSDR